VCPAGVFVDVEGWLETLIVEEESWAPFWFALLTKEVSGLVESRSLQYSSSPQPEMPEHAIPLPVARTLEPCARDELGNFERDLTILSLETRDCEFTLAFPPPAYAPAPEGRTYRFKAEDAATAAAWIQALQDESTASPFRKAAKSKEEVDFLTAAYLWIAEVFSEHSPHKLQVRAPPTTTTWCTCVAVSTQRSSWRAAWGVEKVCQLAVLDPHKKGFPVYTHPSL
jgi:hypothetical protein